MNKDTVTHEYSTTQIVLQWLNYFLLLGQIFSMIIVFGYLVFFDSSDTSSSSEIVYPLTATIVFSISTFLTERIFTKREPLNKKGIVSIITAIHLVIALIGVVIALIMALFSLINGFVEADFVDRLEVTAVGGFSALLLGMFSARLFRPRFLETLIERHYYLIFMNVVVVLLLILSIIYPLMQARNASNDKLIENNLDKLAQQINSYYVDTARLPESLNELQNLDSSTKKLITKGLVNYKIDQQAASIEELRSMKSSTLMNTSNVGLYQLCVKFKYQLRGTSYGTYKSDNYENFISLYSHPLGDVCYKVATSYY